MHVPENWFKWKKRTQASSIPVYYYYYYYSKVMCLYSSCNVSLVCVSIYNCLQFLTLTWIQTYTKNNFEKRVPTSFHLFDLFKKKKNSQNTSWALSYFDQSGLSFKCQKFWKWIHQFNKIKRFKGCTGCMSFYGEKKTDGTSDLFQMILRRYLLDSCSNCKNIWTGAESWRNVLITVALFRLLPAHLFFWQNPSFRRLCHAGLGHY